MGRRVQGPSTAMTIKWRDSMKIGNADLDAEHKKFIALLNLIELGLQESDVAPAADVFEELQIFVESHFPAEEAYLEEIGYPLLETHRKQHETLAYRFYVLQGRFRAAISDEERRLQLGKLASFMREWLIDHLLKEVIELKPYGPPPPAIPAGDTNWRMQLPASRPIWTLGPSLVPPDAVVEKGPGEWQSVGVVPETLERFLQPLDFTIAKPPYPICDFPSFEALCEAAIWRRINVVLLFFQRSNPHIMRELPPPFFASLDFAENLRDAIVAVIFPAMWTTRRMRILATNYDRAMSDEDGFFEKLGPRDTKHILSVWTQTWDNLRLVETEREPGFNVIRVKEGTRRLREMLQPSSSLIYDIPKIGNRELEVFKDLFAPGADWPDEFNRCWKACEECYLQEMSAIADPDVREGSLRDQMIDIFNRLPEPWGDFMILTAHRVFPRFDSFYLDKLTTNFGRTEVAREAAMPYTMRYLRQARGNPDMRAREVREEEEWQTALKELRKYRKWSLTSTPL